MEPDFPVDQVGTGLDTNALIAQQLAPIQALLNRPAPNINIGAPIVPEDAMKAAITRALGVNPPPLRDDQQSSVLGRIGAMLMQPRQQGQSVAGNIGAAVNAGSQMADASRKENQAMAMKQAELGSALATQDVNRRTAEANLQILSTKFPVEFAEMQQRLRKATLEGNAAEVEAIKAELLKADGAKRIVDAMNTAQDRAKAEVSKLQAEGRKEDAQSAYLKAQAEILLPAHAEAYRNLNKPDAVTVIDKDTGRVMVRRNDGTIDYVQITPGIQDATQARTQAKKQLEAEKQQEARDAGNWFPGFNYTSPTDKEINERAAKLMRGEVKILHSDTSERKKPGAGAPGTGPGTPSEQPGAGTGGGKYDKAMANTKYDEQFTAAEQKYGLPVGVLKRIAATESQMNPKAVNPKDANGGSHGLMQVNGANFAEGADKYDPATNIDTAAKLFKGYLDKANGDVAKALAMYKGVKTDAGAASVAEANKFILGGTQAPTGAKVVAQGGDGSTPEKAIVLGGKPGAVEIPGSQIVSSNSGTPVASAKMPPAQYPAPELNPGLSAPVGTPSQIRPVQLDQVRAVLNKAKHDARDLLILESFKDDPNLTDVERAKIKAAMRRGKLGNYS